jgi:hypothetical protein
MADDFATQVNIAGPAYKAAAVTPNNGADLPFVARGIYVGVSGDIKIDSAFGDSAVVFVGVPQGTILPVRAKRVYATGTTATSLVALG